MNVNMGDRVVTPNHGSGLIVNIERFDNDGNPYYDTQLVDETPPDLHRWGVKLDDATFAEGYTNGIAYFINGDLKRES